MKKQNWINKHPIGFALICIVGFIFIIGMFASLGNSNNSNVNSQSKNTEEDYSSQIQKVYLDVAQRVYSDSDVLKDALNGKISYFTAEHHFKESSEYFYSLDTKLSLMNVPEKYKESHKHLINSIFLSGQGADYVSDSFYYMRVGIYDKALYSMETANLKYNAALKEMEKVNELLE